VIPSLGPVTAGHVMVVSRSHAPNLAAMGPSVIDEYNALVESISARPGFGDLLEGEHGAAADSPGGACITHTHVNLIPGFGYLLDELEFTLP
jgi:diadenosine tetraphosphate (Ap4A) HIT family hydrolase